MAMELGEDTPEAWFRRRSAFLVIGAMKGGTTSLRAHLRLAAYHDNLSLPNGEPHFFDEESDFAQGPSKYRALFDWGPNYPEPDFIGDVTPSYMYLPDCLPRIQNLLPHARLVVMLRNPVARAESHQNHDLDKGREVPPLLERCLMEISAASTPQRSDVFGRGLYKRLLDRIFKYFPQDRVHIVVSERYRRNPHEHLAEIRQFLELPERSFEQGGLVEKHVRGAYKEVLSREDRHHLAQLYAQDVEALRCLLGDPIPEWSDDFPIIPHSTMSCSTIDSRVGVPVPSTCYKRPETSDSLSTT